MILPTILSLSRIALAPLFIHFFFSGGYKLVLSIVIFSGAAITDIFDGYIARLYGMTTFWGAFLDPLADKVLIGSALFCCVEKGLTPWWVMAIVLIRDVCITFLRLYARSQGIFLKTTWLAKSKTVLQFVAIYCAFGWLVLHEIYTYSIADQLLPLVTGTMFCMTLMSIYTGLDYFYAYLKARGTRSA